MRIYLDNNVHYGLVKHLSSAHTVRHAKDLGWQGMLNGMLVVKVASEFDVMITVDKGMRHQTKIAGSSLSILVLDCLTNRLDDLLPFVPQIERSLPFVKPGEYIVIPRPT